MTNLFFLAFYTRFYLGQASVGINASIGSFKSIFVAIEIGKVTLTKDSKVGFRVDLFGADSHHL